ncbi:MAG: asparaginase [Pseudomonadota bacterium]
MAEAASLVEVWRGDFLESRHRGHAVVADATGDIVASWGDAEGVVLPRSAMKMLQALPLVESGAADAAGLGTEELALACASHQGAAIHSSRVARWLAGLGLGERDLRCGPQVPNDAAARAALREAGDAPDQTHNNCSGKHAGFLTLGQRLGGGAEYVAPDHPVQVAARAAIEEMSGAPSPGFAIDGCSAPNFAVGLRRLATAMARMAAPAMLRGARRAAAERLVGAMMAHPELVAGEGRACTELMRAMAGRAAVKTGAEGVFCAILPGRGLGIALKIEDGATRAAECVMAALLVRAGVADPDDPAVIRRLRPRQLNRREIDTGVMRPDADLWRPGAPAL